MKKTLALVESASIDKGLERALARAGWRAARYADQERFLNAFGRRAPDAALVDLRGAGIAGKEVLRALRADPKNRRLVLIAVTDRHRSDEAVDAFARGADEYLALPLDAELLAARLASLTRPSERRDAREACYRCGPLAVRPESRDCRIDDATVRLSRLEFDLLLKFVQNPGRVFTRGLLIDELFHGDRRRGVRAVDRHICALRGKLGRVGARLQTLVGIGYCLSPRGRRAVA